jgi:predicted Abi (CAAX) family protease
MTRLLRNRRVFFSGLGLMPALLVAQIPTWLSNLQITLDETGQLIFDLVQIGLMALIMAALLSPLEALGWWAGWYGDRVEAQGPQTTEATASGRQASRYIVYLDGIGQFQSTYSPEAEQFLRELGQALPDMVIVRGIMPYSVLNKTLVEGGGSSVFWRLVTWLRTKRFFAALGVLINIRNLLIVSVSADKRYGPVFNRGMAQLIYNKLVEAGYRPGGQVPVTLLGFSGGGEISMGAAPLLKQAINGPLDIISLAGVFCGHNDILKLEHIYHLVGDKDPVERSGPVLFPKRWRLMFLSYWNRAKRRGQVSLISLGPVGHQTPGGVMDPDRRLPDGRTYQQQTLDWVIGILQGKLPVSRPTTASAASSYSRFQQGAFYQPQAYPIQQSVDTAYYRPLASWMGRLILPLPEQRRHEDGVWFEVYHADAAQAHLVGQRVWLTWQNQPWIKDYLRLVTRDLHFSAEADHSRRQGKVMPDRLNGWRSVGPLESLAGARPTDNLTVMLNGTVQVEEASHPEGAVRVLIDQEPAQISGRFYAIAQFIAPVHLANNGIVYRIRHYNKATRQFDGPEDEVLVPQVEPNINDLRPSSNKNLEQSPCNGDGWYLYGAKHHAGQFVVQALAPHHLFRLTPDQEIVGKTATTRYLKQASWAVKGTKGTIRSVLLRANEQSSPPLAEGDLLLLNHVYGGVGGTMIEPAARGPVYFGHFAYGLANVVREPLTDDLRLEMQYFQVYTHNGDGLIACRHHWSSYMGDRQYGWLNLRPVRDVVIKLDAFTTRYDLDGVIVSPLESLLYQLQIMMARYRIGDGTGATYVGPANNCAQDSNQALYGALQQLKRASTAMPNPQAWLKDHPEQVAQAKQLGQIGRSLKRDLLPWGAARADWKDDEAALGSSLEDDPVKQLAMGIASWRTMLPRVASDRVVQSFLQRGATVLILRTSQVGGAMPEIEPIAPVSLSL